MTMLTRRGILRCLTGIIAAPAIVKADALMKVAVAKESAVAFDALGNQYEAYTSYFHWINPPLLVTKDWRYVAKIANLELGAVHRAPPNMFSPLSAPAAEHGAERAVW